MDKRKAKKIDEEKDKASKPVQGLEDAAAEQVNNALQDNFDFQAGKIVVGAEFTKQLNSFTNQVSSSLRVEPKFVGAVSSLVKRLPKIKEAIDQFQLSQGVNVPAYNLMRSIIGDEYENQILRAGLNRNFIQPLRDLVYRDALSGLTLKQATSMIKDYIGSGKDQSGKLGQYVQQTAQQAVDAYSGMISMKLMDEFKYDGLLMTGSLIDTSSPQCQYVVNELGGIITREDWPTVKKIAEKHGLIEGTNFNNLPVNQLHWGCRHSFYPFVKN